jgi:hypothetical protein
MHLLYRPILSSIISANGYLREYNFELDKINGQKSKFILLIYYKNYIIANVCHIL